jgi:hypothetical protein
MPLNYYFEGLYLSNLIKGSFHEHALPYIYWVKKKMKLLQHFATTCIHDLIILLLMPKPSHVIVHDMLNAL